MPRLCRRAGTLVLAIVLLAACGDDSSHDPAAAPTSGPTTSAGPGAETRVPAAVYHGTTPCDGVTRPVPTMPTDVKCEMATWRVDLRADGRFVLAAAYGVSEPNTPGIRDGGTPVRLTGIYEADGDAIRLSADDPGVTLRLLRVGEDVLHLLGRDDRLLVGNAAWSYTLNREGRSGRSTPVVAPTPAEPGGPGGGVFEGRTPCAPELRQFTAKLVPGCQRLKWRLTLRQNAAGKPAGYVSGVVGRKDASEGTWRIRTGIAGHPDAVVYELRPAGGAGRLSLLLVGGSSLFMLASGHGDTAAAVSQRMLLVGDQYLSYTLSRIE